MFNISTGNKGFILGILDAALISIFLVLSVHLLNAPMEPPWRIATLSASYIIFLYAFDFYSPRRFDASRTVYAVLLVIFFALVVSALLSYALFFRLIGRKILILHSGISFFYLLLRGKWLDGAKNHVENRFFLAGHAEDRLSPSVREELLTHGRILPLPKDPLPTNGASRDFIIVAAAGELDESVLHRLLLEKLKGKPVMTIAGFYEYFFRQVAVDTVDTRFFFEPTGFNRALRRFPMAVKRITDLILALLLFAVTAPIMLLTALVIRLESSGPALFRQTRTGLHGAPFTILKFRSMRNDAEKSGKAQWASEDDPRITRIGRIIRKLRIDELPQLINVIRGDMSFVGPRPERPEFDRELREQLPFYMFRYLVKPGITGWAQVNYGYGASVEDALEKLKYDLYYVKNTSFFLDLEVFLKTAATIFLAKGR